MVDGGLGTRNAPERCGSQWMAPIRLHARTLQPSLPRGGEGDEPVLQGDGCWPFSLVTAHIGAVVPAGFPTGIAVLLRAVRVPSRSRDPGNRNGQQKARFSPLMCLIEKAFLYCPQSRVSRLESVAFSKSNINMSIPSGPRAPGEARPVYHTRLRRREHCDPGIKE